MICQFADGIWQVVACSVFVCAVHLWEKYRGRDFSIDKLDENQVSRLTKFKSMMSGLQDSFCSLA